MLDPRLLQQATEVPASTNNQIVQFQLRPGSDTFVRLAAQCLAHLPPKAFSSVFVATPSGTVWKTSLMQTLHNGLPSGPPQILVQEVDENDMEAAQDLAGGHSMDI